jgi:transposase
MALKKSGMSNCEIARRLGVSEGTIRYRLKTKNKMDGRKNKYSQVTRFKSAIEIWVNEYSDRPKKTTVKSLYHTLKQFHNYKFSYDALRRYVRKYYPQMIKRGTRCRIETPPGMLMQVDWKENIAVQIGRIGNWIKLNFLILILCFSRKTAVVVNEKKTLDAFISGHQSGLKKLGGLSQWVRPDCLKSAVIKWNGINSNINERYKSYMKNLGIQVFPSRPGTPTDKGKVEKKIHDLFIRLELKTRVFESLGELQNEINQQIALLEKEWNCGATGLNIEKSFEYEKKSLKPLPDIFPELPLAERRTTVKDDGTVYFIGNYYQIPEKYSRKAVLCLHMNQNIHIYHDGELIGEYPYLPGTKGMVVLSKDAIENSTIPMNDMVKKWALEVADRQIEYYEELTKEAAV